MNKILVILLTFCLLFPTTMGLKVYSKIFVIKSTAVQRYSTRSSLNLMHPPSLVYDFRKNFSSDFIKIISVISKKLNFIVQKPLVIIGLVLSITYLLLQNARSKSKFSNDSELPNGLEKTGGSSAVSEVPQEVYPPTIAVSEVIPTPLAIEESPAPDIVTPPPPLFSIPKRWSNKKSDKWSPGNLIRPLP